MSLKFENLRKSEEIEENERSLREAVIEIKTGNASYVLPAEQINIDAIREATGATELKSIKVSVNIRNSNADTMKIVQNTSRNEGNTVVANPVDFEVTCEANGKVVNVRRFNAYVERTIEIPDGIDPSKITTGVVLNEDGSFTHVPTVIVKIGDKYFAKINSLTNSTYSVMWNPKSYKDAQGWYKQAVNIVPPIKHQTRHQHTS